MLKNFLIYSMDKGQQTNVEPWLIPEQAFEKLEDAYVWRGRVKKKWGYSLIGSNDLNSRLRINFATTDANGELAYTTIPGILMKPGMMFSVGSEVYTVTTVPTVGNNADTLGTLGTSTGNIEYTSAAPDVFKFKLTGVSASIATTSVYFYPAEPVMGLPSREIGNISFEDIIAFDTQFSYTRSGGAWEQLGTATWTGSNKDFFWGVNARGANPYQTNFYVVNNTRADNIKYIDSAGVAWTNLQPTLNSGGDTLDSARIITYFKDRLVVFNTLETTGGSSRAYPQRCRFSQNGDPTAAATSWLEDTPGRGGYIDAPTKADIITIEQVKGRLIVYFESSTYELVYTGVPDAPFRWQIINSELGCESTFSVIGFDDVALGVGNVGVHACNGVGVARIDQDIPDEVFKIHNGNDGIERVYGIRDYVPELVYWTFPSAENNPVYPDRILLYNYQNKSWAFFNESFTCFGYYQQESDLTWANSGQRYPSWEQWLDAWNAGRAQSRFPDIVAGNQQGFVNILDTNRTSNSQTLYITDMTVATKTLRIISHNLSSNDYILIEEAQGSTTLNGTITRVQSVTDANNIIVDDAFTGTYTGGGKVTRISGLNILTKQFNPGTPVGQTFSIPYIDILMNITSAGEITVEYFTDSQTGASVQSQANSGVLLGSSVITTQSEKSLGVATYDTYEWHRYFLQAISSFIQLRFTLSADQISNYLIATSNIELQGINLYVTPHGRLIN